MGSISDWLIEQSHSAADRLGIKFRPALVVFLSIETALHRTARIENLLSKLLDTVCAHDPNDEDLPAILQVFKSKIDSVANSDQLLCDLVRAALESDRDFIAATLSPTGISVESFTDELMNGLRTLRTSEECITSPDAQQGVSRYVVVIQGKGFEDTSNRYATLDEAKRALEYFTCLIENRLIAPSEPGFFVRFPCRLADAESCSLREV